MLNSRFFALVCTAACLLRLSAFSQGSPNVTLLANVDDYGTYNDCWGYTAPDGREYALLGVTNGTSIIDMLTYTEVAWIPSTSSTWKDIKTYQDYAYTVNESGGGMQIIDLSDLPNSATLVGSYNGFTTSHNIYVDTDTGIMLAEGTSGQAVRVIDLANPLNPVQLSTFGTECHDIFLENGIAYVAEGFQGSIGIYDLSNPASPQLITTVNIPASGYVHNTWNTEDGAYMMSTEETTNKTVKMWDIQDLGNITLTDTYLGESALAHNVQIHEGFAYISHYTDGLKIVDISDPFNIFEVGYYDTYPGGGGGFSGAWGVYPFFASGKILISDISTGLYVVDFDDGTGGTGIPCSDVVAFQSRCRPSGGLVQARVILTDNSHNGETMTITVNGVDYDLTVSDFGFGSGVRLGIPAAGGSYTVELTDPAGCVPSNTFTCSTSMTADGEDSWEDWGFEQTDVRTEAPSTTEILGNYPNPFNPTTSISYSVAGETYVTLKVYNTLGQEVATLVDGFQTAGNHSVAWDIRNGSTMPVSSGIYFTVLRAGNVITTQKMMLMK